MLLVCVVYKNPFVVKFVNDVDCLLLVVVWRVANSTTVFRHLFDEMCIY